MDSYFYFQLYFSGLRNEILNRKYGRGSILQRTLQRARRVVNAECSSKQTSLGPQKFNYFARKIKKRQLWGILKLKHKNTDTAEVSDVAVPLADITSLLIVPL